MRFPIIDLHEDLILHIHHPEVFSGEAQTSWEQIERQNVRIVFATGFPLPPHEDHFSRIANELIEKDFVDYHTEVLQRPGWSIAANAGAIHQIIASNDNEHGIVLHIEGLNAFEDTAADWQMLERWYKLGWRSIGPLWNLTNSLGGGTNDPNAGLSPLGTKLISWLDERGMILDCAHMNRSTFHDAIALWKKPIFVSHGNANALTPSPRNYDDLQLRMIGESGGVIGVFFSNKFLQIGNAEVSLDTVVEHIDYLAKHAGIEAVALGSDFGGITTGTPYGLECIDRLPDLFTALTKKGYTDTDLERIAYKNAARVIGTLLR